MAPLVRAVQVSQQLQAHVITTGQHQQMLTQVHEVFGIVADSAIDVYRPGQTLDQLGARLLTALPEVLGVDRPDAVVVQGDTTTAFLSALVAFHAQIPVVHLEAGLRTGERYNPFPEELNRRLIGQLASLHLAPTRQAEQNLLAEGINPRHIVCTGNTVIDSLLGVLARDYHVPHELAAIHAHPGRVVLVTAHRRESWGAPHDQVAAAIDSLTHRFPTVLFVAPLHPNPTVRRSFAGIRDLAGVRLLEPVSYVDFCHLLQRADLILTDSGGVQEEAPALGKPVLVLRETTERPEAVDAGTARLVGTDPEVITKMTIKLLEDPAEYAAMATAANPFGDGRAAGRCVAAIEHLLGLGPAPRPFAPGPRSSPEPRGAEPESQPRCHATSLPDRG